MKKKLSLQLSCLLGVLVLLNACKKSENNQLTNTNSSTSGHHAYGIQVDKAPPTNVPHADFAKIKADLIAQGYLSKLTTNSTTLPSSIILSHPTIADQGLTSTCVSFSAGYAVAGVLNLEFPTSGVSNNRSPWFVYQINHTAIGDCSDDGMSSASVGLDILKARGVPSQSLDNTFGSFCSYTPTTTVSNDAALDKVSVYSSVTNITDVKTALSLHLPLEMALNVYSSFETAFSNHTTFTGNSGSFLGGHAVCIIGYDDSKNAVLVQNSWGTSGGDLSNPGCMWIDYNALFNSGFLRELYVVYKAGATTTSNIAEIDISKGDTCYYWTKTGMVSAGSSTNSTLYRAPQAYTLPSGKTPANIVGIAIASTNWCYYWYNDGTMSVGTTTNATAYIAPKTYALPAGETPTNILSMSIAKSTNSVYTWFKDGNACTGNSTTLDAIRGLYPFTVASGQSINNVVGIGIAGSNDHTYAWYYNGTGLVSSGSTNQFDYYFAPVPSSF